MFNSSKLIPVFAVMLMSVGLIGIGSALGNQPDLQTNSINFDQCSTSQNHHCMEYLPGFSRTITGNPQNWNFNIFMPDGTCNINGKIDNQGNCNSGSLTLSDNNFTQLKQNPGVFAVRDIFSTSSGPLTNYCPLGLFTLTHEDGYFYRVQNVTNLMYPDFCVKETGPNPFPVPEFGQIVAYISAIAVFSAIVISAKSGLMIRK